MAPRKMPQSARRPKRGRGGGEGQTLFRQCQKEFLKKGHPFVLEGWPRCKIRKFLVSRTHLRRTTRGSWSRWCQRHDLVEDGDCDDEDEDDGCDHQDNHDHQDDATWPKTELDERFAHRLHLVQVLMKIIDVSGYVMQSIFKYLEIIISRFVKHFM